MPDSGRSSPGRGLDGVLDHLLGPEASFVERVLVVSVAVGLTAATVSLAVGWTTAQYAVGVIVALDLGGGVVANATRSATTWFHREARSTLRRVAFVAGHVHPFAISVVFTPIDSLYGGVVYGLVLASAGLVLWVPVSLKRPVAMASVTALIALDMLVVTTPSGLGWFVPVFGLKLLVGHLVPETTST